MVQWRNRRASIMSIIVPIIILFSWRDVVAKLGGPFALSSCITIGLIAVGLMGYANTTARDREKGVFQRLRVTPAATWQIMSSRLTIQIIQMAVMTLVVFVAAYFIDKITLTAGGYVASLIVSAISGAVFLSLALAIVGWIKSAETVNSVTRLIYIALVFVGVLGELGVLGASFKDIVLWSPYGTVKAALLASMTPATWDLHATLTVLACLAYTAVFAFLGVKWFQWSSN